jgi:hypothetical protein
MRYSQNEKLSLCHPVRHLYEHQEFCSRPSPSNNIDLKNAPKNVLLANVVATN